MILGRGDKAEHEYLMLFKKRNLSLHEFIAKMRCLLKLSCWEDDRVRFQCWSQLEKLVLTSGLSSELSQNICGQNMTSKTRGWTPTAYGLQWCTWIKNDFYTPKWLEKDQNNILHYLKSLWLQTPIKFYWDTAKLMYLGVNHDHFQVTTADLISCVWDLMDTKPKLCIIWYHIGKRCWLVQRCVPGGTHLISHLEKKHPSPTHPMILNKDQ